MIYCDNAATSFPKPEEVYGAVSDYLRTVGASPGRSAHGPAVAASRIVFDTREKLARLFTIPDSERIVFTANATEGLNCALAGVLRDGDTVVTSSMEHNSVMRPLRALAERRGVVVRVVPSRNDGSPDIDAWETALSDHPRLAVINHASNVTGAVVPLERIGAAARKHGVSLLVDAAQSAGALPIDVREMGIDLLACSGHKSLYGPQGTGMLYIGTDVDLVPLKFGGTGSRSDSDEQPAFMPDRFESGTLNGPGIAGLGAGVDYVLRTGIDTIRRRGREMSALLLDTVGRIDGVCCYGPPDPAQRLPTLSITVDGRDNGTVARLLDERYGICTRMGLHCAPNAHRTIGTFPEGTVRISPGLFSSREDIEHVARALKEIREDRNAALENTQRGAPRP
mgnify:CR=1 FL=1